MKQKIDKAERQTIGALSQELLAKEPDTLDPVELQQEIQGDSFEHELLTAVERGKKKYHGDFFIVPVNQRFRLFPNVIRTYFIDRLSCPTPEFDQAVYRYIRQHDHIEFLWVIPDRDTCSEMYNNMLMCDPEKRDLLQFVLDFYDGTLLQLAKKLNNEEKQDLVLTQH